MPIRPAVLALWMAVSGTTSAAHAADIECPRTIVETPSVSNDAPGWQVVAPRGERALEQVGLYLGDPTQQGAQVPERHQRLARQEVVAWRLRRAPGDVFWVACAYQGTTAQLFQEVPADATRCEARYDLLPNGRRLRVRSFACR